MAEDDWDGWARAHRRARRPRAARRRRPVRHQHRAPRAWASTRGVGQLDPHQGQPDRHAHRDARDRRARARAPRYTARDVAPLGRDRGHHDRRPRRRDELRPDQDRRAGPLRSRRPSTTSCCASRKTSASRPPTSAAPRSRHGRAHEPAAGHRSGRPPARRTATTTPTPPSALNGLLVISPDTKIGRRERKHLVAGEQHAARHRHPTSRPVPVVDPERIIDPGLRQRLHPERRRALRLRGQRTAPGAGAARRSGRSS